MLEQDTVPCPYYEAEIVVKVLNVGTKTTYLADTACQSCGKPTSKIETAPDRSNAKSKLKVEKSCIKLDPRG